MDAILEEHPLTTEAALFLNYIEYLFPEETDMELPLLDGRMLSDTV